MSGPGSTPDHPIPVYLLTGFLGSGKTTLLNRMLRPDGPRTAVIVNEFGDVPIDNDLFKVDGTSSSLVETSTGCICCEPGNDIESTLVRLSNAIDDGEVAKVERVVVETTGLADPSPIINQMLIASRYSLGGRHFVLAAVITTLDALKGEVTVEERLLAHKQLAFADRVAITKADMLDAVSSPRRSAIDALIARINPAARVFDVCDPLVQPEGLLADGRYAPDATRHDIMAWLEAESPIKKAFSGSQASQWLPGNRHTDVYTTSLILDAPLTSKQMLDFLNLLHDAAGDRLLRLKGLVAITDDPERPYLLHIVQGIMHQPERLEAWPSEDRRTRLVLIADGIDEPALDGLLASLKPTSSAGRSREKTHT